jgi:alginate O-acetyltransferase complex protein AlgJ
MVKTRARTISNTALIVLFLTVTLAPPVKWMFSRDRSWSDKEKRVLTPFPKEPKDFSSFLKLTKKFESYYDDHFGFREVLIDRYQREVRKRFGETGVRRVIGGKEGWYFYAGDNLQEDFMGLTPLKEQQLKTWKIDLIHKRNWLAERGIHYLFVVVPNKQTIYPEYLPDFINKAKGETRLEQLMKYLKTDGDVHILDLTPVLRKAKHTGHLYSKTDTHWNFYGAYLGYKEIMHQISQWFPKEHFKNDYSFDRPAKEGPGGDLAEMLGMQGSIKEIRPIPESRHLCARRMELPIHIENPHQTKQSAPFMKGCKEAHLRALIFRDSFFLAAQPFLSEDFREAIYIWRPYDQEITERLLQYFHPDVVIEERAERFCFRPEH